MPTSRVWRLASLPIRRFTWTAAGELCAAKGAREREKAAGSLLYAQDPTPVFYGRANAAQADGQGNLSLGTGPLAYGAVSIPGENVGPLYLSHQGRANRYLLLGATRPFQAYAKALDLAYLDRIDPCPQTMGSALGAMALYKEERPAGA